MKNEYSVDAYGVAKSVFREDIYKFKFSDMLKIRKYLLLLKSISKEQDKLDSDLKSNAIFNEIVTSYIVYIELCKAVRENQELAMSIVNKECVRLQEIINSYNDGNIRELSYEEMESILMDYSTDDAFMYATLRFLFDDELINDNHNKVLKYNK